MMNYSVAKVLQCRQQRTLKARHVPFSLLGSLFVFVEVVLLLEFVVCCVGEVFVCLLLLLLCLFVMMFGFFVLVLEDYPHLHFVYFTSPLQCQ